MLVYILIFFSLVTSLFILFTLSKNDFILMRRNISQVDLFNKTLLLFTFSVISGRMVYILDKGSLNLLNPLLFLHFYMYPGLSFIGGLLGIAALSYLIFDDKKALPRILDIIFLSISPFFLTNVFLIQTFNTWLKIVLSTMYIVTFSYMVKFHKNYSLKDGSVFAIITIIVCLTFFISQLLGKNSNILSFSLLQIINIIIIILSLGYLVKNENIFKIK